MKKKIVAIFLLSVFFLFLADGVFATEVDWPTAPLTGATLAEDSEFHDFIAYAYGWGIGIGGILTFVMIVWGGIEYMLSVGDPGKQGAARGRIQSAVLGLVLLLSAYLILNTINPQLTQLRRLPPLWDPVTFMDIMPDEDILQGKPCEFVILYSGENYTGSSSGRLSPGEYEEDFDYNSGRGYRQMTEGERTRYEEAGGGGTLEGREVLDGNYIEGETCSLTLYYSTGAWWWRDACGRVLSGITLSASTFDDYLQLDPDKGEEIECYTVNDVTATEAQ